ncbi:MAG: hypothetical protein ACR2KX_09125 [Chitinophagaceae bacterium]
MSGTLQLSGFLKVAAEDARLLPTHISLYLALFLQWDENGCKNPVVVNRDEIMHVSKILGRSTYQRCIKQLVSYGYINYKSSFNRFESSLVYIKEQS